MTAKLKYVKYHGKSAMFGTDVSSIGIKRVDNVVPAVYGDPSNPMPGDDASDAYTYSIIKEDGVDVSYSYESIFKIHLTESPDNQLTNIRMYLEDGPYVDNSLPSLSPSLFKSTNGVATINIENHGLSIGQTVVISGTNEYNGTYTVSGLNSDSFNVFGINVDIIPRISSLTFSANTVTAVCESDHGLSSGDYVEITSNVTNYNGIYEINVTTTNTFTYALVASSIPSSIGSASKVEISGKVSPINLNASDLKDSIKPKLFVGCSQRYNKPTNTKSQYAVCDLADTSEDNPFRISIGGVDGYSINKELFQTYEYQVSVGDIGTGNLFYLNGRRQLNVPIIEGNTYTLVNNVTSDYTLAIYDDNDVVISDTDITESIVDGNQVITINATPSLLSTYPNGFKYGDTNSVTMGSTIYWYVINPAIGETIDWDVEVKYSTSGVPKFYIDGSMSPVINFKQANTYIFRNRSGSTHPFRFVSDEYDMADESNIIINGVSIENGGTENEVVTVVVDDLIQGNALIYGYQSTMGSNLGDSVRYESSTYLGGYNMNTIGGGTNITAAGETDYIYLQLVVDAKSDPGEFKPNIIIEYDES
jgi:hypothetical protein